jgi:hypothetical protein
LPKGYKTVEGELYAIEKGLIEEGGEQIVEMGNIDYSREIPGESYDVDLSAKVCFPYQTTAQIMTCVSSLDIERGGGEKVCKYNDNKVTSGSVSSGPIQITSLTESLRSNQVLYEIEIKDNGGGKLYKLDPSCTELEKSEVRSEYEDVLDITVEPSDIRCRFFGEESNSGKLKLTAGTKKLICEKDVRGTDSSYKEA